MSLYWVFQLFAEYLEIRKNVVLCRLFCSQKCPSSDTSSISTIYLNTNKNVCYSMIMVHWLLCLLSHMNNGGLTCVCIMCLICDATLSASPSLLLFILMEQDESIFFLPLPLSFQSCQPLCQWEKWFLRVRVQQRGLCSSPSLPLESTHMQMGRCGACVEMSRVFSLFFFFLHSSHFHLFI